LENRKKSEDFPLEESPSCCWHYCFWTCNDYSVFFVGI